MGPRLRGPTDDEPCTSLKAMEIERAWDGVDDRGMRDNLRVTWLLREEGGINKHNARRSDSLYIFPKLG